LREGGYRFAQEQQCIRKKLLVIKKAEKKIVMQGKIVILNVSAK
jgi:hypothetical protein